MHWIVRVLTVPMMLCCVSMAQAEGKANPEVVIDHDHIYTMEEKLQLLKSGFEQASKAIPCPCIWNNPRKRGTIEYEDRTWGCEVRDANNQCVGVKVKE